MRKLIAATIVAISLISGMAFAEEKIEGELSFSSSSAETVSIETVTETELSFSSEMTWVESNDQGLSESVMGSEEKNEEVEDVFVEEGEISFDSTLETIPEEKEELPEEKEELPEEPAPAPTPAPAPAPAPGNSSVRPDKEVTEDEMNFVSFAEVEEEIEENTVETVEVDFDEVEESVDFAEVDSLDIQSVPKTGIGYQGTEFETMDVVLDSESRFALICANKFMKWGEIITSININCYYGLAIITMALCVKVLSFVV